MAIDGVLGRTASGHPPYSVPHPPWNVLCISPTWKQAKDILFEPCLSILSRAGVVSHINRSDMRLRVGNARLDCASGERPDNIRGRHFYDLILIDEFQKQHADLFDAIISPMLHVRKARVVFAGTPLGPMTKLQLFYEKGQSE